MSRSAHRTILLASLSLVLSTSAFAQNLSGDTITVDPTSKNTGNLSNALVFGGPRTVRAIALPGHPAPATTIQAGAGIASNRSSGNVDGLDFYTANPGGGVGTVRMSITSNGRIGIGTIQPTRAMQINGTGDVELGLQGSDSGGQNGRLWTLQSSGITPTGPNAILSGTFQIIDRTAGLSRLQIDSSGQVTVDSLRILGGADLAEPFSVSDEAAEPGSVMVIDADHPGRLRVSSAAYDRRVAGVVSGAGGIHTALTLTQAKDAATNGEAGDHLNVALSGRVYVLADESNGPIEPGDLLTTSNVPGHCMKASDADRAHGAILGKAMSPLATDKGMVLALVTLQ